jgi:hypothetical protein
VAKWQGGKVATSVRGIVAIVSTYHYLLAICHLATLPPCQLATLPLCHLATFRGDSGTKWFDES